MGTYIHVICCNNFCLGPSLEVQNKKVLYRIPLSIILIPVLKTIRGTCVYTHILFLFVLPVYRVHLCMLYVSLIFWMFHRHRSAVSTCYSSDANSCLVSSIFHQQIHLCFSAFCFIVFLLVFAFVT